jgi:hypothetical protein
VDLETFRSEFLNDVQVRIAADGGFTDYAFAAVAADRLEEAHEVANFESCPYRSSSGRMRIDGYAFDSADDSLRVFVVHRAEAGELQTLTQTDARTLFNRLLSFVDASFSRRFEKTIDENHPARDFAETLLERKATLSRIRAYLITDCVLSTRVKDWPEGAIDGVPTEFHIWDIGRFHRAHMSMSGLDEVVVDFRDEAQDGLPCLAASMPGSPYISYLCVLPGPLLARIYDEHGSRLLEGNVRAFLTAKGKVNQGIRRTLLERPEMFFAYNNGIAAVASEVTIEEGPSGPRLITATDLQIVNGGQTTASIENVKRVDKAPRLEETFVPMKLSVVSGEQSASMIAEISRFANSQNKVSDADFFANHPFHQRLEQISRRVLAPARAGMQYETRWFYERARGQYLNEFVKLTPAQRERVRLVIPKSQIITKTDLAKSELSWQERPHNVSQGAQNFFLEFAKRVDAAWNSDPDAFHEEYFRSAVSRLLVFRTTEHLVSAQPWYYGGYRAIIVTYAIAKLARELITARRGVIDLKRLWRQQELYPALASQVVAIAEQVFDSLSSLPESQQNLTQWAKRQGCWEQVQKLPVVLSDDFLESLVDASDASLEARAARAMQQVDSGIDYQAAVLTLGPSYWQSILAWAEKRGSLASSDRNGLRAAAGFSATLPTDKQCKRLLQLKERFEEAGFTRVTS